MITAKQAGAVNSSFIPVNMLEQNPWNCNVMSEKQMRSLELSIAKDPRNMKPLIVRALSTGRYQIIDGAHRHFVAQRLGWAEVPCIVKEMTDDEAKLMCLSLNVIRGKLNPVRLLDLFFSEWEGGAGTLSTRGLEEKYGHLFDQSWITRILNLRKLDKLVRKEVEVLFDSEKGESITTKHLMIIAQMPGLDEQMRFLRALVATNVSVATLERMVEARQRELESDPSRSGEGRSHSKERRPSRKHHSKRAGELLTCKCGESFAVNWRRRTVSRLVEEGSVMKAVQVDLAAMAGGPD